MTAFPVLLGELEVRAEADGSRSLSATFPYGKQATIASAGSTRKERFEAGSLSWQTSQFATLQAEMDAMLRSTVNTFQRQQRLDALDDALEKRNTHMLLGHSFDRAIADMRSGTLAVEHRADAVYLRATLPPAGEAPSWVEDAVRAVRGGQLRGVSPGFSVPPGQGRERLEREVGGPSMVRVIEDAVAWEYSLVSRPAYSGSTVDARADDPMPPTRRPRLWL